MSDLKMRILLDVFLFTSIFIVPLYGSIAIALIAGYRSKAYPEIILSGVFADLIFGVSSSPFLGLYTISMLVLALTLFLVRPYLRS